MRAHRVRVRERQPQLVGGARLKQEHAARKEPPSSGTSSRLPYFPMRWARRRPGRAVLPGAKRRVCLAVLQPDRGVLVIIAPDDPVDAQRVERRPLELGLADGFRGVVGERSRWADK